MPILTHEAPCVAFEIVQEYLIVNIERGTEEVLTVLDNAIEALKIAELLEVKTDNRLIHPSEYEMLDNVASPNALTVLTTLSKSELEDMLFLRTVLTGYGKLMERTNIGQTYGLMGYTKRIRNTLVGKSSICMCDQLQHEVSQKPIEVNHLIMTSVNLRSILDSNKLTGLNFLDWFQNLRIILKAEKLAYVLDQSLTTSLDADATANQLLAL
ncbi:hypothetical protein ZIOFF_013245 [Zingiber officinale]|uniref:Uncharacterized protein n=1 Tax=Zingiber officinale TaxID=94328 RepID=A0A8J5HBE4_ZINOF|nr:hypothetical protein ZIOFF_013245 [Zingiber officinale]